MVHRMHSACSCLVGLVVVAALGPTPATAQHGAVDGEWRAHGADNGATRYSPLDQITADNVDDLRIAWTRSTVDQSILDVVPNLAYGNGNRATPLMVDGVLYASNAVGLVEAFDPGTGETIWVQQPFADEPRFYRGVGTRGVAYWTDGDDQRIIVHRGEFLYALNAKTGTNYVYHLRNDDHNITVGFMITF